MSWRDFWNGNHSIYVGERHRVLHYRGIAEDVAALVRSPQGTVLDYGCGEALSADIVAGRCARLFLYDAAPRVREKLATRFGNEPKIVVLDEAGVDAVPDASVDLIVANSLAQYLTSAELETLLDRWRAKLSPQGELVLGDIIPPDASAVADAWSLLRFARRGGFFIDAVGGLAATFFSDYRTLRQQIGLTRYAASDVLDMLAHHGFTGTRAARNIGHNQGRMMFVARRTAA